MVGYRGKFGIAHATKVAAIHTKPAYAGSNSESPRRWTLFV